MLQFMEAAVGSNDEGKYDRGRNYTPRQRWVHVVTRKMDDSWAHVMCVKRPDIVRTNASAGNAFPVAKWVTSRQIVHYARRDRRLTYPASCG